MLIKETKKNKVTWKIGHVTDPIIGKDGVTRGYKILTGNGRPLQLVCDLEIGGINNGFQLSDGKAGLSGNVLGNRAHQHHRPAAKTGVRIEANGSKSLGGRHSK